MFPRRLLIVSVLATLPLFGVLAYRLQAADPAPTGDRRGLNSMDTAMLHIELKKAQIQATLAVKIAAIREKKLGLLKALSDVNNESLTDAVVDLEQAKAAVEISNINVDILQVQVKDTAGMAPAGFPPKNATDPLELKIMKMELRKAQIQTASIAQIAQVRQQQLATDEGLAKAGKFDPIRLADIQVDTLVAQANADTAALDLEAYQQRVTAFSN